MSGDEFLRRAVLIGGFVVLGVCAVLTLVMALSGCAAPHAAVVVGKQRVPAHEEVTPAGPGYCCAFDLNMKLDCGMHLNCPEERRQVQERCVLTVKGDGCKAVEVDWSCATFDNVEVGQVVTTTAGCAAEPTRRS